MNTKIRKWGNSYAVRLPKSVVHKLSLRDGSAVTITAEAKDIKIKLAHHKPTLKELVAQITPENRPPFIEWGIPVGKEVW